MLLNFKEMLFDEIVKGGSLDIERLEDWCNRAAKLGITIEEASDFIDGIGFDKAEVNAWFYAFISLMFERLIEDIIAMFDSKKIKRACEKLKDKFSPYINYLDSWFNNSFDEIDWDMDKDNIICQAVKLIEP